MSESAKSSISPSDGSEALLSSLSDTSSTLGCDIVNWYKTPNGYSVIDIEEESEVELLS